MSVRVKATACDCFPALCPWSLDLTWCGCQLPSECELRGSALCLQLPSPGSSITHVNTQQWLARGCVGWAPRTWLELPDWQAGLASLWDYHTGLVISSGLFCGSWPPVPLSEPDATFLPGSAGSQGGDHFGLRTQCSTEVFPQLTQGLRL